MIIGQDLDGCVANIEPELNRRISQHYGIEIDEVRKDKFYMHDRFDIEPREMERYLSEEVFSDPAFWEAAEPFKANILTLRLIAEAGHKIVFITGRHNTCRSATERWLEQHVGVSHVLMMQTLDTKHRALKYVGAEIMIEDRYHEALTIAQKGFRSYLLAKHYNVIHMGNDNVVRWVDTIEDVAMIEELINV